MWKTTENRGVILVYGTIDAENTPNPDEFDPSFDRSQLDTILAAIRAGLA
jgi:hypothetical protein